MYCAVESTLEAFSINWKACLDGILEKRSAFRPCAKILYFSVRVSWRIFRESVGIFYRAILSSCFLERFAFSQPSLWDALYNPEALYLRPFRYCIRAHSPCYSANYCHHVFQKLTLHSIIDHCVPFRSTADRLLLVLKTKWWKNLCQNLTKLACFYCWPFYYQTEQRIFHHHKSETLSHLFHCNQKFGRFSQESGPQFIWHSHSSIRIIWYAKPLG